MKINSLSGSSSAMRIIGKYEGQEPGPLLICIGGIHGNEPAGISAIEDVLQLLILERQVNPAFQYHGTFIGIRGNLAALGQKKRFINRDLNRMLTMNEISRIQQTNRDDLTIEDTETVELIESIESEIMHHASRKVFIIDFHTTTADGGIFTISPDDQESLELAISLHAPVILGIAEDLQGTTIQYFHRPDESRYCIVFEAGQHQDPECIHRSTAAIVSAMKKIGSVRGEDVNSKHEKLLLNQSRGLPVLTRLIHHYKIQQGENFTMQPG